jgi:outer membrane protein OmpA-like peptidoglycan-associated protein
MSKNRIAILALIALLAAPVLASAAEVQLIAMSLKEGSSIDIRFVKTDRAPKNAAMQASISFDKGQSSIKLMFQKMEPAVLFAGDISAYVLWAVTLDGSAENLGEVAVDKKSASGSQQYYSGKKIFALMVTAEPFSTVNRPTDVVIFTSGQTTSPGVQYTPFGFKNFSADAKPALESIAMFQYNDDTPAAVRQAAKAIEMAEKLNAAEVNPQAVEGAKAAYGKALAAKSNKSLMADQARAAAQLASQAIKEMLKAQEVKAAAEAEERHLAEKAALEARATTAEGESARIAQQLKEVETQRQALAIETADLAKLTEKLTAEKAGIAAERDAVKNERDAVKADRDAVAAERDRVAADREAIKAERDELASRLKGALSSVADTTESARGVVVSLSGILFDAGKATLKSASQISVAKLAGILIVFPQMNLSIEGYTDSTGSNETNMRLSMERARAVYEFLMMQGISSDRMKYQGFGPENPVAPNDTETNRAKNRRVEVVLTQAKR